MNKSNKKTRVVLYPNLKPFLKELMKKNFSNGEGLEKWNEDCVQLWGKIAPDVQNAKLTEAEIDTSLHTAFESNRGAWLVAGTIGPLLDKVMPGLGAKERLLEAYDILDDDPRHLESMKTVSSLLNVAMASIKNHKEHLSHFSDCYDCLVIQNALKTKIARMEAA